jgi:hypothetical protein
MIKKVWNNLYQSVCSINLYSSRGICISSFTGFKSGKYLFTEFHGVQTKQQPEEVKVRFYGTDGYTVTKEISFIYEDFEDRMLEGLDENNFGFTAFNFDLPEVDQIPSLFFAQQRNYQIGTPVALIGYQSEFNNLTLKSGNISSFTKIRGSYCLQYEVTMTQGMSGCPVVDLDTGLVVGIGGVKMNKMNESYIQLMQLIKGNLSTLQDAEGKMTLSEIDPIQVLVANQNQIKYLAKELYKNLAQPYGIAVDAQVINAVLQSVLPNAISNVLVTNKVK